MLRLALAVRRLCLAGLLLPAAVSFARTSSAMTVELNFTNSWDSEVHAQYRVEAIGDVAWWALNFAVGIPHTLTGVNSTFDYSYALPSGAGAHYDMAHLPGFAADTPVPIGILTILGSSPYLSSEGVFTLSSLQGHHTTSFHHILDGALSTLNSQVCVGGPSCTRTNRVDGLLSVTIETAIPEPATLGLLTAGLLGLAALRLRRVG
jgi:hypothetical protein